MRSHREQIAAEIESDDVVEIMHAALERAEKAEAAIARVRELHRKASHGTTCVYCARLQTLGYDTDWPCDTIRALDGDDS